MNKLYRTHPRVLGGVCSGMGKYFNIDPVFIRLLWFFSMFFAGTAIIVYLIAWIIIPEEPIAY